MGGKTIALLAATLLLAAGSFGCVGDSAESAPDDAEVETAQAALDLGGTVDVDVSATEQAAPIDGTNGEDDPEPHPWVPPDPKTSQTLTVDPSDPLYDPDPVPWAQDSTHDSTHNAK